MLVILAVVAIMNPLQQGLKRFLESIALSSCDVVAIMNPLQQGLKHPDEININKAILLQ